MSAAGLHDLNQRYIRLTDRCRSQWTFYQLLQGAFKHLRDTECPVSLDFPELFGRFRALAEELGHPETTKVAKSMDELEGELNVNSRELFEADREMPPSMLRRFIDSLRRQDEKVVLAIIKFYLDSQETDQDALDKLDILFTRLAELPREGGGSVVRERHEIERMVQPLLQHRRLPELSEADRSSILDAISDLRAEVLSVRSFQELTAGGALDRFRATKRALGDAILHPALLPSMLETTVAIKNRFHELWEDEEQQLLSDTNKVLETKRLLDRHPELATDFLRELFETLATARQKVERGKQDEKIRREDILELRRTLNQILEECEITSTVAQPAPFSPGPAVATDEHPDLGSENEAIPEPEPVVIATPAPRGVGTVLADDLGVDPLLHEHLSKILFAFELVGPDRSPAEMASSKEVATLRLEAWEVEAIQRTTSRSAPDDTLAAQKDQLLTHATALRVRLDEEAREIDRLRKRGSERLPELLDRATASLQRAVEFERRLQWFIDDALYRGATENLEALFRSRMRLLRAYSGLWLIHNDSGGISPF